MAGDVLPPKKFVRNRGAGSSADPGSAFSADSDYSGCFGCFAACSDYSGCSDSDYSGFADCSDSSWFFSTEYSAAFQKFLLSAASSVAMHQKCGALLFCTKNAPAYIENTKARYTVEKSAQKDSAADWNNPKPQAQVRYSVSVLKRTQQQSRISQKPKRGTEANILTEFQSCTYI